MKCITNSQRGTGGGGEKLVISLKTNQASHEDLIGAKFSVVINGNATEYTWQGASMTIDVPPMLSYTVEFGEVEGYAKPESVTHTAVAGNNRFITGTYNTELVTVNVSAEEGEVSGYEIQIISDGNVLYTQTTSSASYKIPYGTSYVVKANDVSGYTTPSEQSFTASQPSRNVDVVYGADIKGIFIQDIYGRLYTEDEWDGTQIANGIAVLADECEFVVALTEQKLPLQTNDKLKDYMTPVDWDDESTIIERYNDCNGMANTANMLKAESGINYAPGYCNSFIFPNGAKGYLPAIRQLTIIRDNVDTINTALSKVGATLVFINMPENLSYWSSTYLGVIITSDYIFCVNVDDKEVYTTSADGNHNGLARPLTNYISPDDIITFYINVTKYSCVKGTTWEQWCKSAFNTDGWYVDSDGSTIRWDRMINMGIIEYVDGVSATDIISGEQYFRNEKEI